MFKRIIRALLLIALAVACPAFAVPPVLPRDTTVIQRYMRAIRDNDLPTYSSLFADSAKVTTDANAPVAVAAWIDATEKEFVRERGSPTPMAILKRSSPC